MNAWGQFGAVYLCTMFTFHHDHVHTPEHYGACDSAHTYSAVLQASGAVPQHWGEMSIAMALDQLTSATSETISIPVWRPRA